MRRRTKRRIVKRPVRRGTALQQVHQALGTVVERYDLMGFFGADRDLDMEAKSMERAFKLTAKPTASTAALAFAEMQLERAAERLAAIQSYDDNEDGDDPQINDEMDEVAAALKLFRPKRNTKVARNMPRPKTTRAKSDRAVIAAFLDRKPASGKKLDTDGKRLDGAWMGGNGIARWSGDKIEFGDLGSKAAQTVQNAIRRAAPKSWLASTHIAFENHGTKKSGKRHLPVVRNVGKKKITRRNRLEHGLVITNMSTYERAVEFARKWSRERDRVAYVDFALSTARAVNSPRTHGWVIWSPKISTDRGNAVELERLFGSRYMQTEVDYRGARRSTVKRNAKKSGKRRNQTFGQAMDLESAELDRLDAVSKKAGPGRAAVSKSIGYSERMHQVVVDGGVVSRHPTAESAAAAAKAYNGSRTTRYVPASKAKKKVTKRRRNAGKSANEVEAHELILYIDNDAQLKRHWKAIVTNLWKHKERGNYSSSRAADGFMYLVDAGAKAYRKEFGGGPDVFSKPTRRHAAEHYAEAFEQGHNDVGQYAPVSKAKKKVTARNAPRSKVVEYIVHQHSTTGRWFVSRRGIGSTATKAKGFASAVTSPKGHATPEEAEKAARDLAYRRGEQGAVIERDHPRPGESRNRGHGSGDVGPSTTSRPARNLGRFMSSKSRCWD